jgi:N-acyl-D-aspartate/D-glutamate deacylase
VTSRAEEYRRYARQCLEIAPTFQDEEARATLLGLAQTWARLAHLALANRQIAELAVQIVRQRVIIKHALDTGQRSEMAESLLNALEESLRIFEKHRIFLLSCSAANNGQQGKSPGSEAGARLGFVCHGGHP